MRTPGHSSYLIGQALYYILKACDMENRMRDEAHPEWMDFAARVLSKLEKSKNSDFEYPYILSEKTGAGLEYDSLAGAWCLASAAYYSCLKQDSAWLEGMKASESHYYQTYIARAECYGGPLDTDKAVDSEGVLAYIRAVRWLHRLTGEEVYLNHLRDALYYEFTFKFCYNSPVKAPPLSKVGWSSCGGSITSVANPHIYPMSSTVTHAGIFEGYRRQLDLNTAVHTVEYRLKSGPTFVRSAFVSRPDDLMAMRFESDRANLDFEMTLSRFSEIETRRIKADWCLPDAAGIAALNLRRWSEHTRRAGMYGYRTTRSA